jgi:hypothetical protein
MGGKSKVRKKVRPILTDDGLAVSMKTAKAAKKAAESSILRQVQHFQLLTPLSRCPCHVLVRGNGIGGVR